MVDVSFDVADRSDMQVVFNEPLGPEALHSIRRLDGVIEAEGFRSVAVVLRHGLASHRGAVTGLPERPRLSQALTLDLRPILMRKDGLILAQSLARKLGVQPGDVLTVEVLEGRRPVVDIPVAALTTALVGAPVYLEASAFNASLGEVGRVSGAYLRTDAAMSGALLEELKGMPGVAGVSPKADARASMRKIMDQGAGAIRYVMALVAGLITFGVVYNSARIAFAERAHELASLRVIGFTRGEAGFVLLGELGVITLLALPIGALAGTWLAGAIAAGFSSELYEVPGTVTAGDMAFAAIVVIVAALVSGFLVRRDADRLDLVSALKTRE
jgi:putative ABC transport system permease protein